MSCKYEIKLNILFKEDIKIFKENKSTSYYYLIYPIWYFSSCNSTFP